MGNKSSLLFERYFLYFPIVGRVQTEETVTMPSSNIQYGKPQIAIYISVEKVCNMKKKTRCLNTFNKYIHHIYEYKLRIYKNIISKLNICM